MPIFRKRIIFYSFFISSLAVIAIFSLAYYQLRNLGELKVLAIEKLEQLTRREVNIGEAEMDIVRGLSVRLKNVSVRNPLARQPEIKADSVWVVVKLLPLLEQRVEVKKIIVQGLSVNVIRDSDGRLSIGNVKQWITQPTKSGPFKVLRASLMNKVLVEDGEIQFQDHLSRPPEDPLSVSLKKISISLRKNLLDSPFQFTFKGEIPSGGVSTSLQVSGEFDNFSSEQGFTGISINGRVRVDELNVSSFQPYLKQLLTNTPQDSWLSLDSSFSGNLGGALKSEGTLKYSSEFEKGRPSIRDARVPRRGVLEYRISLDQDSIVIDELRSETGPFKFNAKGSLKDFFSNNPSVSFSLLTDFFQINKSIDYLPFKLFPEKYHKLIQSRFKNGSIKIKALKFNGSLKQFKELAQDKNRHLISSELELKRVDWQSPLPALQNVTGNFKLRNGDTTFRILKASYENQPITNVKGSIKDFMLHPVAELNLENKVQMSQFHKTLKQIFKDNKLLDSIAIYDDFEGTANVRLDVKGPLSDLAIAGKIDLNNVSLDEQGFDPRLENLNGKILYTHTPEAGKRKDVSWIPVIKYDQLSGRFSKSSFSDMRGEMGFSNGEPLEKMSATYNINFEDLPHVFSENPDDALAGLREGLDFSSGEMVVKYHSQMNPIKPETEEEWGKIELKNFSMRYADRYRGMMNLKGNIAFGGGKVIMENLNGRYGDSYFQLEGEVDRNNIKKLEYAIRLNFPELMHTDFKDIPLLKDFKYAGPAHVSLNLNGNLDEFKFEHRADLAQVGYEIPGFMKKRPNALNKFKAIGSVLKDGGIFIENWSYELGGNQITGTVEIPNFENPEFTLNMASDNFQINPSQQFFRFIDAELYGVTHFNISGSGNLNNLGASKFEGEMKFEDLKVRPKDYSSPLIVDAHLIFKEDRLDIRSGEIKSDKSAIQLSGVYLSGDAPSLNLDLTGGELNADELFPEPQSEDISMIEKIKQSEFFSNGKSEVRFDLKKLGYKHLRLGQVAGSIVLDDKTIKITNLKFNSNQSISSGGKISIDPEGIAHFETSVQAKKLKTENLFSFFGEVFQNGLSGDVKYVDAQLQGEGKDWKEIFESLSGELSLDIQKGSINQEKLKRGIRRLFSSIPQPNRLEEGSSTQFKEINGSFVVKNGVFETQNFIFETESRRTSIVGTFDVVNSQIDTVVGVAPLAELDRFLTKIPVVGKIITGGDEKSILKSYYTVKGSFDDPDITMIPFTSLGKRVMGIFQGILQAPQEILTPITDNLPNIDLPVESIPNEN